MAEEEILDAVEVDLSVNDLKELMLNLHTKLFTASVFNKSIFSLKPVLFVDMNQERPF